ncbi:MAG: dienelactone hydrolase family protein, partial [Mycobacterium sp.]|nr:dienelactone hydrolase family protein [Mycobacterium sp.]
AAGVPHTIEWYAARHGFAVRDHPSYDAAAEERHWQAMTKALSATLSG